MSETIWHEQVATALRNFIRDNVFIDEMPVRCKVRKPDEDFKTEEYPFISIYNVYDSRDDFRTHFNSDIVVKMDKENRRITLEKPGIPYNLFYQIDFWSMQYTQLNSMTQQFIAATGGKDFNLPVETQDGVCTTRYALCVDDMRRVDEMDFTSRVLHCSTTYRIYAEIDENIQKDYSLITDVVIKTRPKEF